MVEDLNHCSEMVFNSYFKFARCEIFCFFVVLIIGISDGSPRGQTWVSGHLKITQNGKKRGVWGHGQAFTPHMRITQCEPTFSQPCAPGLAQVATAQAHTGAVELKAAGVMGFKKKTILSLM